ncbi:hypothetical protein GVAV_003327 [Gurleya vavrai]
MSDKRKCNLEFMNKKQSIQSSLYNILIENKIDEHVKNNFLIRIEKQEFEIERINKKLERLLDENEIYKKVLGDKNSFNDKFCCDEQKENVNNSNNYNLDDKYCCDEQKEIMNNLDKNSFNDNYCCDKQNENIINLNNVKEDFKLIKFDQNLLLLNNKYKKEIDELELENANLRLKIIKNEKERKLIVKEEKKKKNQRFKK